MWLSSTHQPKASLVKDLEMLNYLAYDTLLTKSFNKKDNSLYFCLKKKIKQTDS